MMVCQHQLLDIYCPGQTKWPWFCFACSVHLFELDQTFFTADGFTAVLPLQHEAFVGAHRAADVANEQGQVVEFVVVDEAGVAANPECQAIQGLPDWTLRMTKQHVRMW